MNERRYIGQVTRKPPMLYRRGDMLAFTSRKNCEERIMSSRPQRVLSKERRGR